MDTNVIIGAGQAGVSAARSMRDVGFKGRIIVIGFESVLPYSRPPLSKTFLTEPGVPELTYLSTPDRYQEGSIEFLLGTFVEGISPQAGKVHLDSGATIEFDRLIIATGSEARRPVLHGAENLLLLRTYEHAVRIRSRLRHGGNVVCVGAGVIGLEIASSARALGCKVTVIEYGPRVMSRSLTVEASNWVEGLHRNAGVEFVFNARIEQVDPSGVVLLDGSRFPADIVVAGTGINRNIEIAREAGIATNLGIVVNNQGKTNIDGIYAAGEVAEYFSRRYDGHVTNESWQHAHDHGALVGQVASGVDNTYDNVPWFWSDQHKVNIQMAGSRVLGDRAVFRGEPTDGSFSIFYLDGRDHVTAAVGFNAGRDISAAMRLIRANIAVDPGKLADSDFRMRHFLVRLDDATQF